MSFLNLRSKVTFEDLNRSFSNSSPRVEFQLSSKENGKVPSRIIKRVSQLFGSRKKSSASDSTAVSGAVASEMFEARLNPVLVDSAYSQWTSPNEDDESYAETDGDSIYDIRCPSGLGRSASHSSDTSVYSTSSICYDKQPLFYVSPSRDHQRKPTMLVESADCCIFVQHLPSQVVSRRIPNEVLMRIFEFLPRSCLARLAIVSPEFCTTAQIVMYEHLDLRTLREKQVQSLVSLLAYRRDLADLVRTFQCHTWPAFFIPQDAGGIPSSSPTGSYFSPTLTAAFTIAFQNMHRINALVLPSFDAAFVRHHSAFMLRRITFLCTSMSSAEKNQLFIWLDGQANVTHLLFPNLMDDATFASNGENSDVPISCAPKQAETPTYSPTSNVHSFPASPSTPTCSMTPSPFKPHMSPASPSSAALPPEPFSPSESSETFKPSTLLPSLTTIWATSSLVTSLICPGDFPHSSRTLLHDITININKSLYTGLRPSIFMSALRTQRPTRLVLRFGPHADRRTVGKVLTSTVVLFANSDASVSEDFENLAVRKRKLQYTDDDEDKLVEMRTLTELVIELARTADGKDQAVYKALNTVLPRYHGLVHLHLRFFSGAENVPCVPLAPDRHDGMHPWMQSCPSLRSVTRFSGRTWRRT